MISRERISKTLLDLLAIPSPCGFTDEIVRYVGKALLDLDVDYQLTRRGTIRARLAGEQGGQARAIVTHLDTIGAMVRQIRSDGRIMLAPIGNWSSRFAEGARVTVFAQNGAFRGCILPSIEWGVSQDAGVDDVALDWDNVELRVEEAVFNQQDVHALGIEIGNFVAFESMPETLENGYIVGRNIDNKAGTAAVIETIRHLVEADMRPTHDTYVLFTIDETTGSGIGGAVLPEVSELVTVDFESVRATEKSPFKRVTLARGDASGPYDYHLTGHLHDLAVRDEIPFQQKYLRAFHSDAAAALAAGHDVRTAVIAYAGDASHSVERTHLESLTNVCRILEAYVTSEPTFEQDEPTLSVKEFPRQITEENMPRAPRRGPDPETVILTGKDAE